MSQICEGNFILLTVVGKGEVVTILTPWRPVGEESGGVGLYILSLGRWSASYLGCFACGERSSVTSYGARCASVVVDTGDEKNFIFLLEFESLFVCYPACRSRIYNRLQSCLLYPSYEHKSVKL
jgi:hypothetical protein